MRSAAVICTVVIALATTTACSSRVGRGAAIGGAGGAAVGAIVPGVGVAEGAAIGAAGGAIIGALGKDDKGRDWYRDERGNRYWVDKDGRRHYD